jgi:hypothetical protein
MPTFDSKELLNSLQRDVKGLLSQLEQVKPDDALLNQQPAPDKWSATQVIEHLNSYNRFYLPAIKNAMRNSTLAHDPVFKAGWFGNYFTNMMMPKAGGKIANKMNAPKDHVPVARLDSQKVIAEFIAGSQTLLSYLQAAEKTDIGKIRVPISISKLIKLKLGDTFRFLIAHQQRHFVQLANTLATLQPESTFGAA